MLGHVEHRYGQLSYTRGKKIRPQKRRRNAPPANDQNRSVTWLKFNIRIPLALRKFNLGPFRPTEVSCSGGFLNIFSPTPQISWFYVSRLKIRSFAPSLFALSLKITQIKERPCAICSGRSWLKSDREQIAQVALKNERFARNTDERIPNPDHITVSL